LQPFVKADTLIHSPPLEHFMRLARLLAGCAIVAAIALLSSDGIQSREKADTKPKIKGQLPQAWSKLDLTDEQKDKLFTMQAEHKQKVDKLKEEIAKLDAQMVKDRLGLLTEEQRAKLRMMVAGNPDPKDKK
jgi:Spy/CpxP family protein refolding chaperone